MLAAPRGSEREALSPSPLTTARSTQIARNVARNTRPNAEPRDEGQKIAQALLNENISGGHWLRYGN